jgi:hypothetical protein
MRGTYLSAIDDLPGLDGDANLLAVTGFETDARGLAVGGHVRDGKKVRVAVKSGEVING